MICLTWLVAATYGALPYLLAGDPQLGHPVDAVFEGMSGFTTTGAGVATDVAALPISLQVWRQLTIWLGGIGVVAVMDTFQAFAHTLSRLGRRTDKRRQPHGATTDQPGATRYARTPTTRASRLRVHRSDRASGSRG